MKRTNRIGFSLPLCSLTQFVSDGRIVLEDVYVRRVNDRVNNVRHECVEMNRCRRLLAVTLCSFIPEVEHFFPSHLHCRRGICAIYLHIYIYIICLDIWRVIHH